MPCSFGRKPWPHAQGSLVRRIVHDYIAAALDRQHRSIVQRRHPGTVRALPVVGQLGIVAPVDVLVATLQLPAQVDALTVVDPDRKRRPTDRAVVDVQHGRLPGGETPVAGGLVEPHDGHRGHPTPVVLDAETRVARLRLRRHDGYRNRRYDEYGRHGYHRPDAPVPVPLRSHLASHFTFPPMLSTQNPSVNTAASRTRQTALCPAA